MTQYYVYRIRRRNHLLYEYEVMSRHPHAGGFPENFLRNNDEDSENSIFGPFSSEREAWDWIEEQESPRSFARACSGLVGWYNGDHPNCCGNCRG